MFPDSKIYVFELPSKFKSLWSKREIVSEACGIWVHILVLSDTLAPACKDHACKKKSGCKNKILRVQKVPIEGCYSKLHGCKNTPLERSIFSWDERSTYMWAPVYIVPSIVENGLIVYTYRQMDPLFLRNIFIIPLSLFYCNHNACVKKAILHN